MDTWTGSPELSGMCVPIDSLTLDPNNARQHSARNLEAIKISLQQFGQQKPIVVDKDGVVFAGSGTLAAARQAQWTHIAALQTNLSGDALQAYAIADNKTTDLSEWNFQQLADTLQALPREELAATGFLEHELAPLLAADWSPLEVDDERVAEDGHAIRFNNVQWQHVHEAIQKVRVDGMSDAQAVVQICQRVVA